MRPPVFTPFFSHAGGPFPAGSVALAAETVGEEHLRSQAGRTSGGGNAAAAGSGGVCVCVCLCVLRRSFI
jgi:hypothetical protein